MSNFNIQEVTEPGDVLITDDMIPLRFIVLDRGFVSSMGDLALYCTARDVAIVVNAEEFFKVENPTVAKMTTGVIAEEINVVAANVASKAFDLYVESDNPGGAELL